MGAAWSDGRSPRANHTLHDFKVNNQQVPGKPWDKFHYLNPRQRQCLMRRCQTHITLAVVGTYLKFNF